MKHIISETNSEQEADWMRKLRVVTKFASLLLASSVLSLLILTLSFLCFTARVDAASVAHFTEQSDYIIHVFRLFF